MAAKFRYTFFMVHVAENNSEWKENRTFLGNDLSEAMDKLYRFNPHFRRSGWKIKNVYHYPRTKCGRYLARK